MARYVCDPARAERAEVAVTVTDDRQGQVRTVDQTLGVSEVEVTIPAVGLAPELKRLLGVAARLDVAIPLTPGHGSGEAAWT